MITDKLYNAMKNNIRKSYPKLTEDQIAEALHFGIIEAEKGYDPQKTKSFQTWVWMIVKYRLIDKLRLTGLFTRQGNERVGKYINISSFLESGDKANEKYNRFYGGFTTDIDPSENVIADETKETILRQFTGEKYRRTIELKIKGFSTKEVAKEMKIPKGTVNCYLYQIRNAIKEKGLLTLRHYIDPDDTIRYAVNHGSNVKKMLKKRWTEQREMNRA